MNERKKLALKMDKRIGMRAVNSENMRAGTITGYNIEEGNRVHYLICYDGQERILHRVAEDKVVLMKAANV